ncbi:hypothetical protein BLAT2472_190002 [Burkholderia latens]
MGARELRMVSVLQNSVRGNVAGRDRHRSRVGSEVPYEMRRLHLRDPKGWRL